MKHPNPNVPSYLNRVPNIGVNVCNIENDELKSGKLNDSVNANNISFQGSQDPPPQYLPLWKISGNLFVRTNSVSKLIVGLGLFFSIVSLVLFFRIQNLESQNVVLKLKVNKLETTLNQILSRFPDVPDKFQNYDDEDDNDNESSMERVKREAAIELSNNTTEGLDSKLRNARRIKDQLRSKGKLKPEKIALKEQLKKLKKRLKASNLRNRDALAKLRNEISSFTPATANSINNNSDAKGIYLIPSSPNVNIRQAEQLIGPWYAARDGSQYGFNDYWYNDISLDNNGTSVIFHESGLHLIYAQVYYHISLVRGETPPPMGYRIYLRKNTMGKKGSGKVISRPIPLAECVPSYPSTFYQTCFTQVVWHVERGDQIYLEHFADSYPMIEADDNGKTFLGIVKLSTSNAND